MIEGTTIGSYPKIYNIGHRAVREIFNEAILIEEKIDGSQFSFGIRNGQILCRSHKKQIVVDAPDKMFELAVESVKSRAHLLQEGWVYRGEYLQKPKHNSLAYDRVPKGNIMLFDICPGMEDYLLYNNKQAEAHRLGLETVPRIDVGRVQSKDDILGLLTQVSVLGGQAIEGVVVKNYERFGVDGKVLMAKHVSEAFKEVHRQTWGASNPTSKDIVTRVGDALRTTARWNKAIQHLREDGTLVEGPQDIGPLIKEIKRDVEEECVDEIKDMLYKWALSSVLRSSTKGFPEWYKEKLLDKQFEEE